MSTGDKSAENFCLCSQVRRGGIGAQCGLVFAYNSPSDKFHAEEHFKRFEKYDKWKLQELRQFVKSRYSPERKSLWSKNCIYLLAGCGTAHL